MTARHVGGRSADLYRKRLKPDLEAEPATSPNPPTPSAAVAEVASYIAQLTAEMGRMASAAKLDVLAYFLAMARLEAETIARRDAPE